MINRKSDTAVAQRWLLGFALAALVAALCFTPSPATDLFWQMRTGGAIAATHHFPTFDTYSWSRYGTPWIVHEWGMCVLLWRLFTSGGYAAVWIFEIALLLTTFLTLYVVLLRETNGAPVTSLLLAVWAAWLVSPLISPRPHLFTYLFLVVIMGIVLQVRRDRFPASRLWWTPAVCAVWANFHAGVVLGAGIIAAFGLCDLLEATFLLKDDEELRKQRQFVGRRELLASAACFAAMLLNPYGVRIFEIFGATVSDPTMPSFVQEWKPVNVHSAVGQSLLILTMACALSLGFSRQRRGFADIVLFLVFTYAAFNTNRNVSIFALAAVPLAARHIASTIDRILEMAGKGARDSHSLFGDNPPMLLTTSLVLAVTTCSAAAAWRNTGGSASNPSHFVETTARHAFYLDYFPEAACRFLEDERFPTSGRLYNSYGSGSYIEWRTPQYPVFISTQTDVYFGKVLSDYVAIGALPYKWREILGQYHPDFVLTSADAMDARLFLTAPEWRLVYVDRPDLDNDNGRLNAMIFVRDRPEFAALIQRCLSHCPSAVAVSKWRSETF